MSQFSLVSAQAKLDSLNTRAEKHGSDNVPACDLKLTVHLHSSAMDSFHPGLRTLLYRKPGAGEQQTLPLEKGDDHTELTLPKLKPMKWEEDFPGYDLQIGTGLDASDVFELKDVELSSFTFAPLNGGSVSISFSATAHPTGDQVARLYTMIQNDVQITLEPPKAAK